MKLFRSPKRSLRANLVMGVVAMLLPWVMFVLLEGQILFPQVIGAFEDVVQETGADMHAQNATHIAEALLVLPRPIGDAAAARDVQTRQRL